MTTPVFYNYPLAFNPAKAKLALEEKGIKYTEKKIDIFSGQSLEPWYLKLNPNSSAPTLKAGDTVITESADIVRWADEQEGGPLGGDKVDREFISEWLKKVDAWNGNTYVAAFGTMGPILKTTSEHKIKVAEAHAKRTPDLAELYNKKVSAIKAQGEEDADKGVADANKAQLVALLDEANERLGKTKFLAGDEYSVADAVFTAVVFRIFLVKQDKELVDSRENVKKWWLEVKKRPSYKKTFSVAESGLQTGALVFPTLIKIKIAKVFKKY